MEAIVETETLIKLSMNEIEAIWLEDRLSKAHVEYVSDLDERFLRSFVSVLKMAIAERKKIGK